MRICAGTLVGEPSSVVPVIDTYNFDWLPTVYSDRLGLCKAAYRLSECSGGGVGHTVGRYEQTDPSSPLNYEVPL